jgi:ubiquinone/menaquinone biosynthesis C-methylase UbiE
MRLAPMSNVKRYYDEKSATYDAYAGRLFFRIYDALTWKALQAYIPAKPEARVLDAAGGTGKWSVCIAGRGPRVTLVDFSDGMLRMAQGKVLKARAHDRIEISKGDLRNLKFNDESFDLVFCDHALSFIKEQEKVVKELTRVLKRGCPLIISARNRYSQSLSVVGEDLDFASKLLLGSSGCVRCDVVRIYTLFPDELRQMLEMNGIRIRSMQGKVCTMPLGISWKRLWSEKYSEAEVRKILEIESALMERADTIALGAHVQAVGYKR